MPSSFLSIEPTCIQGELLCIDILPKTSVFGRLLEDIGHFGGIRDKLEDNVAVTYSTIR